MQKYIKHYETVHAYLVQTGSITILYLFVCIHMDGQQYRYPFVKYHKRSV